MTTATAPAPAESPVPLPTPDVRWISLEDLRPHPANRKHFDKAELAELAESLKSSGQLTPAIVRPTGTAKRPEHQILAGERRWMAAQLAGLPALLCLVREVDDAGAMEILAIENNQRANPHPLDEAELYKALLAFKGYDVPKIATKLKRSQTYVRDRLKLLQLTKEARKLFLAGRITESHAVLLARLKPEEQARAMDGGNRGFAQVDGLFIEEHTLFEPESNDGKDPLAGKKLASVREFEQWIDQNVRVDPQAADLPDFFPATAAELATAQAIDMKVVHITYQGYLPPEVEDPKIRTLGPMSWKRADGKEGSKPCQRAVLGLVAAGEGRGQAFLVCIDKKECDTHWGAERRRREKATKEGAVGGAPPRDSWEEREKVRKVEEAKQRADDERVKKALKALLTALAGKVKAAPLKPLVARLLKESSSAELTRILPAEHAPQPADVLRHLALCSIFDSIQHWQVRRQVIEAFKPWGIDAAAVAAIVDKVAPKPAEPKAAAKPAKKLAGDVRRAKKAKKAKR